ncbi:aryl-sulfate sulfotransferase [Vibrio agarivorans]|uniref:Aryl-sulfate sulfotransferase n=1 Tax=Vibrio agarivorans TaxID=153622 RepID=A0ABT7Y631_9VIBR|nr:aryl-sulfate sulfotransferase [Vibrio agarivorans]MDN2483504.1 aryl-sulfate sulfotransferase [Vibrio agarivorans]
MRLIKSQVLILTTASVLLGCSADDNDVSVDKDLSPEYGIEHQPENPIEVLMPTYHISAYLLSLDTQPSNQSEVFTEDFQQRVSDELTQLDSATFDSPALVIDPFKTNPLSLYTQFKLPVDATVTYTVTAANVPAYQHQLDTPFEAGVSKGFSLYGLFPGTQNHINIHLTDEQGLHISELNFSISVSSASLNGFPSQLDIDEGEAMDEISNGIYLLQGNNYVNNGFSFWLDNQGYVRGQIMGLSDLWSFVKRDGFAYYNPDNKRIVKQDLLTGKIVKVYQHERFEQHHDHILLPNGNLVILVTNTDDEFIEDHIIEVDANSNEVVKVINMRDIINDYPHENNRNDWIHINSIEYMAEDNGTLILSARELSSMIKLTNYHGEPELDWFINYEGRVWQGSDHADSRLNEVGNITPMLGQHTVQLLNRHSDDVYDIYGFNNHFAMNRGGYDGHPVLYDDVTEPNDSYLTIYQVDERSRSYEEIGSIPLQPKSNIRSSAQRFGDAYIIGSLNIGMDVSTWYGRIDEYTQDYQRVISIDVPDASYRVTKFQTIQ